MTSPWIAMAEHFERLGLHERAGAASDPRISEMYRLVTGTAMTDSVPWCAAFVGACLELSGYAHTNSLLASSYKTFGEKLARPQAGCIVVLKPQAAGASGHVGFFDSLSGGRVRLLGGNQGDAVKVQGFDADDIVALRWPVKTSALPGDTSLPTILAVAPDLAPDHLSVAPPPVGVTIPPAADDILIAIGDRGGQVEALQKQLSDLNYHLGAVDGQFGTLTRAALLAFQADNDLATTGVAGAVDLTALASAPARPLGRQRAAADVETLRETGSQTVATADWLQKIGIGTGLLGALGFTDKQTNVVGAGVEGVKKALNVAPSGGALRPEQLAERALDAQRAVQGVLTNEVPANLVLANGRPELVKAIDAIVSKTTFSSPLGDAGAAAGKVLEAQREIAALLGTKLTKTGADPNHSKILFDIVDALRGELAKPLPALPQPTGGTTAAAPGVLGPLLDLIPALIGGNGSATWLLVALGGYLAYSNGGRISQLRLKDYRDAANQNR